LKNQIKNIFIAIAPNHILNFENIIEEDKNLTHNILLNPGNFKYNKKFWIHIINGDLDINYKVSNGFQKIRFQIHKLMGYRKFIKEAANYLETKNSLYNYYYCNLDDILSNHFFYYLIENNLSAKNYVVEDGVLNYYYPEINISKLKSKKFLAERILKLKFESQLNHPTAINSKNVEAQYVRLPQKSICKEKSITLPSKKIQYTPDENIILVIGQDIMHNSKEGAEYYERRLEKLLNEILKITNRQSKVIYKPHRNGDYTIAEKKLNNIFSNFEVYHDITPIEECIINLKPKHIYSFESSAMLNLKIAMNESKVNIRVLPFSNGNNDLTKIFNDLGIEILK
jgi:hypothetical protein